MASYKYLIGIDEVGRGPLAGPLTFCALSIRSDDKLKQFKGSKDSKKLSSRKREGWFARIRKEKENGTLDFTLSHIEAYVLDKIGLSNAIKISIERCLKKLKISPKECKVLLDGGLRAPAVFVDQKTIIKGDEKIKVIGLASIVAKVSRDRRMIRLAKKYPQYGFELHKGYGTKEHYARLKKYGVCEIHRKSFLKNI